MRRLSAENLDTLLDRNVLLGGGLALLSTEDELSVESPCGGDLPGLSNLGIDQRVVVLEVGTETFSLESSPEEVLLDSSRLNGPRLESVGVDSELALESLDGGVVDVEEDSSGSGLEAGNAAGGALPALGGDDGLESVGCDVPELVVLSTVENDDTVGLRVEG